MSGTIAEFQCQTGETNAGYPIVCVSVRVQLWKRDAYGVLRDLVGEEREVSR